ncbi:MAG: hypothetical protein CM15mP91_1900 [Chloroflexota bacterium]|nr:MAG: hypothetical protein CM15mP91_1900 [Chloroflexota bacterium]
MAKKTAKFSPLGILRFIFIESTFKTNEREKLIKRISSITESPLIILAFAMIPLLLGPYIWDLSQDELDTFNRLDQIIWALFVINLIVKVIIAPRRLSFLKSNILEVIVVIPYLQPLRIVFFGTKAIWGMTKIARPDFLIVVSGGLVIISATIVTS